MNLTVVVAASGGVLAVLGLLVWWPRKNTIDIARHEERLNHHNERIAKMESNIDDIRTSSLRTDRRTEIIEGDIKELLKRH